MRKFIGITDQAFRAGNNFVSIRNRSGVRSHLRVWLAESIELVTSRTTSPYKNYHLKPVNFDGFINYYQLEASESRNNKTN